MDGVFYLAIISGLKIEMELEMESADQMKTVVRVGRLSVVSSVSAGAQRGERTKRNIENNSLTLQIWNKKQSGCVRARISVRGLRGIRGL